MYTVIYLLALKGSEPRQMGPGCLSAEPLPSAPSAADKVLVKLRIAPVTAKATNTFEVAQWSLNLKKNTLSDMIDIFYLFPLSVRKLLWHTALVFLLTFSLSSTSVCGQKMLIPIFFNLRRAEKPPKGREKMRRSIPASHLNTWTCLWFGLLVFYLILFFNIVSEPPVVLPFATRISSSSLSLPASLLPPPPPLHLHLIRLHIHEESPFTFFWSQRKSAEDFISLLPVALAQWISLWRLCGHSLLSWNPKNDPRVPGPAPRVWAPGGKTQGPGPRAHVHWRFSPPAARLLISLLFPFFWKRGQHVTFSRWAVTQNTDRISRWPFCALRICFLCEQSRPRTVGSVCVWPTVCLSVPGVEPGRILFLGMGQSCPEAPCLRLVPGPPWARLLARLSRMPVS